MPVGLASSDITTDFVTLSGTYIFLGTELPVSFGGSEPFTIEGWVGYTALESAVPLFSKAGELIVGLTDDARVFARRRFWEPPLIGARVLEAGLWHHVGLTCDGRSWTLYVDGVRDSVLDLDASGEEAPAQVGSIRRTASVGCEIWNLRIWNRVQSQAQMLRAMRSSMAANDGLVVSFFPELPTASRLRLEPQRVASRQAVSAA